ncbi:MAG: efflux RND transporter permease subunit [Gemmatimonadales bacterium]|nr:efflux RND transporter permease subunit [Gemmatimonadales bacterium]
MFLSNLSIKRPVFATMMMLALVVLGVFSFRRLGLDNMPDVQFPFVLVQTRYPGASPEAVERELTKRIEEAVNTVQGVKRIESSSVEGFSSIFIEFQLETNVMNAQNDVRSKIEGIKLELPGDADPPIVSRYDPSQQPIVTLSLSGDGWAMRDLTRLATETIKRRIENVNGVGNVSVVGGLEREIHVELLPAAMEALGVSPDMVIAALRRENQDTPAGRVERGNAEQLVRVRGRIRDPMQFASVVVAVRGGAAVRLGQVARIEDTQEDERSFAAVAGRRAIGLDVRRVSGANIVEVADGVNLVVAQITPGLPRGVELKVIRDDSRWTRSSLEDVELAMFLGAGLTVLIVFIFLNSWRSTVITGLTLPVSVISAFLMIYAMGFTINTMTLMALSLAIGILIDDAIVVRENIVRHVERGQDHHTAAREGTSEIGFAVFSTTLSILAVFVPVAFMGGIVGKFFYQFGITIAFAVAVSLFVSFTLDPMLSSIWYDPQAEGHAERGAVGRLLERFNGGFKGVSRRYRGIIAWALDHRGATMGIASGAMAGAIALMAAGAVGGQFMPISDQEETQVFFETPVGSSLSYTRARGEELDRFVRARPEVAYTYLSVGGDEQGNVNQGAIYVKLRPRHERALTQQQLETQLRAAFRGFHGVTPTVQAPSMGGGQLPIQINVLGPDVGRLQQISDEMLALVRTVPGAVEMQSSLEGRKPEFVVEVDRDLAANVGLSVGQVSGTLRPILAGQRATTYEDETGLEHDVVVRVATEYRTSAADIARIPIATSRTDERTQSAVMVPLGQVARIGTGSAPGEIKHLQLERMARLEGNYEGRSLTEVMNDIRVKIADVQIPPGYRLNIGGESADFAETVGYILESLTLAVVFIYLILASQFGSFLQPLAIMLALPLSIIGVLLGLMAWRDTFNIMSMIGIIMLMGLVTKNAILLVDFANKAREAGKSRFEALVDAGEIRLRPIIMTTLAMIFGMLPTALALGDGGEFRAPMARAVIGGLITSTLLTLVVVPVVYTFLDDFGAKVVVWMKRGKPAEERAEEAGEAPEPHGVLAD